MYCSKCGQKFNKEDKYCINCGNPRENTANVTINSVTDKSAKNKRTASIILGIISIVGVFFIYTSPISLILAIIGLVIGVKANKKVKNIAGIILNALGINFSLGMLLLIYLVYLITHITWY